MREIFSLNGMLASVFCAACILPVTAPSSAFGDNNHGAGSFLSDVAFSPPLPGGKISADGELGAVLTIESAGPMNAPLQIAVINKPAISKPRYALTGLIRYSNVPSAGFLEIWNHFGSDGSFFSRTLGSGFLAPIAGSSGWRRFVLPFYTDNAGKKMIPEQIVFNLLLPQGGTVSLAQVELHQFSTGEDPLSAFAGGWWSPDQLARYSMTFSTILAVWWIAVSFLAWRSRARAVVIGSLKTSAILGALLLIACAVAAVMKQPFHVVLPLGILGVILAAPVLVHMRKITARYNEIEARRMLAQDVRL